MIEDGQVEEARQFLLESLSRPETGAYHTIILQRLIGVVKQQRSQAHSLAETLRYDDEIISYLEQLWYRTRKPFYLYRLGQTQLEKGDLDAARESFAEASEKFPADSIYREPARKLAESLKTQ